MLYSIVIDKNVLNFNPATTFVVGLLFIQYIFTINTKLSMKKISIFIVALVLVLQGSVSSAEVYAQSGAGLNDVSTTKDISVGGVVTGSDLNQGGGGAVSGNVISTNSDSGQRCPYLQPQIAVERIICPSGERAVSEKDVNGCYIGMRCVKASIPDSSTGVETAITPGDTSVTSGGLTPVEINYRELYLPVPVTGKGFVGTAQDPILSGEAVKVGEVRTTTSSIVNSSDFSVIKSGDAYAVREISTLPGEVASGVIGQPVPVKKESINMTSSVALKIQPNKVIVVSEDGKGQVEVIKPSMAKEAVMNYSAKVVGDSIKDVELKVCEGNSCASSTNVYEIKAEKKVRFLFIIPMKSTYTYTVDASTKEVINEKAPWYGWMTR